MIQLRWILSTLLIPFLWKRSIPLVRPNRIGWNSTLIPQKVQINKYSIFYIAKGEGKPIILIHGYGAGMWVWEKQIDVLSSSYRVFALDLIGHGYSDKPRISYTPETYIYFFKDFMDALGIDKAILIGNSMGGGIAWAVAAIFPERVEKLVLINSIPPDVLDQVKNDSFRTLVAIQDIPLLPYLVMASRNKNSVRWILLDCVSNTQLITLEVVNRQYQLSQIQGTTWVLYSTFKNAKDAPKLKDCLSRIYQPTLLLWGKRDRILPISVGESLHKAIQGSKFQVIEKSGHIPMWETPEEVNQAILSFLENHQKQ